MNLKGCRKNLPYPVWDNIPPSGWGDYEKQQWKDSVDSHISHFCLLEMKHKHHKFELQVFLVCTDGGNGLVDFPCVPQLREVHWLHRRDDLDEREKAVIFLFNFFPSFSFFPYFHPPLIYCLSLQLFFLTLFLSFSQVNETFFLNISSIFNPYFIKHFAIILAYFFPHIFLCMNVWIGTKIVFAVFT